jgi:hypothetical protein
MEDRMSQWDSQEWLPHKCMERVENYEVWTIAKGKAQFAKARTTKSGKQNQIL